jgi:biopolymer transport protein ExbD
MAQRKKNKQADRVEVPMSAMIDVVFLLLVYFILTFKIEPLEAHMTVNMPSPSTVPGQPPPVLLEVKILPDRYVLNGVGLTLDTVERTIDDLTRDDRSQTLIIKVGLNAKQHQLISLLDRCEKLDLENLNVLTLKY